MTERDSDSSPKNQKQVRFDNVELDEQEKEYLDRSRREQLFAQSRKKISLMTTTELIKKDVVRRNLILIGALSWGVKVIDWMLFSIWVGNPKDKGGMGFTNLETGAVSLLSFPCVAFAVIATSQFVKHSVQTNILIVTTVIMLAVMVSLPLIAIATEDHQKFLFVSILLVSVKESSYLIWISCWSSLISRFVPSMMLGRVYSWSYFLGHLMLCLNSQIFPRGLSLFIKNERIIGWFGRFRYSIFFLILGIPLVLIIWMSMSIKKKAKEIDNIET